MYSGSLTGNTFKFTGSNPSIGVAAIADQSPATPAAAFTITNNSFSLPAGSANVYVPNEGFTDAAGVCVQNNATAGPAVALWVVNPIATPQSCSSITQ